MEREGSVLEASQPGTTGDLPPRRLGAYDRGQPGPMVVLLGGMHGNEPAGVRAVPRVLEALNERQAPLRGRVLGLAGNRTALSRRVRFVDRDLNRGWLSGPICQLLASGDADTVEDREQRELLAELAPLLLEAREPIVFLDLHSTSGGGAPFSVMADVLRNRPIAFALPVPVILGIEERLDGTLLGYLCELGHVAIGFEGGQNDDPETVLRHEAAIWITLVAAGCLRPGDVPDLEVQRQRLALAAAALPPVVEIRHRHEVRAGDEFEMLPGFANFSPIRKGQPLAWDCHGPIRARERALMLMPRYQGQGDDGFFLVRPVSRLWLDLSAWLRRARLDRLITLLPGVARDPERPGQFLADRRIARFQTVNLFHLFGYRHVRRHGRRLAFSRRRPSLHGLCEPPPELRELERTPGAEARP